MVEDSIFHKNLQDLLLKTRWWDMERKKGEKDKKEGEGELHGREKGKKEEKRKGRKKIKM